MKQVIKSFIFGVRAKGEPVNYPSKGEKQIFSTTKPVDKAEFNDWANELFLNKKS